ncbi:MAG: hypothetical protein KGZ44_00960, partial [Dethiobacter sp.]|nr:hypothetical protein [Dethiobacter sp.]
KNISPHPNPLPEGEGIVSYRDALPKEKTKARETLSVPSLYLLTIYLPEFNLKIVFSANYEIIGALSEKFAL